MPTLLFKFKGGLAGKTGEVYYTVGILRGREIEVIHDPEGYTLVFMDRTVAERIQTSLVRLQDEDENFFIQGLDKAVILLLKLEVGAGGRVIPPNLWEIRSLGHG